ncbi:hypothetical protein NC651_002514 [Populus alba x Populus x berolinensis]|nr:hypothetical protein NC651_002514 [Populus alba x Populus x berolinensis]
MHVASTETLLVSHRILFFNLSFLLNFAQNHAIKLAGIVDLYSNLAFGEGVYLPNLCANPRRAMYQTRSNGDAAPATIWWCRCRLGSDSHLIPSLE